MNLAWGVCMRRVSLCYSIAFTPRATPTTIFAVSLVLVLLTTQKNVENAVEQLPTLFGLGIGAQESARRQFVRLQRPSGLPSPRSVSGIPSRVVRPAPPSSSLATASFAVTSTERAETAEELQLQRRDLTRNRYNKQTRELLLLRGSFSPPPFFTNPSLPLIPPSRLGSPAPWANWELISRLPLCPKIRWTD